MGATRFEVELQILPMQAETPSRREWAATGKKGPSLFVPSPPLGG
jgi:hypothetical protein